MTFIKSVLGISVFALAVAFAKDPVGPKEPAYNPATVVNFKAVVVEARLTPGGNPFEGVHVIAKSKTNTFDVYLGPADFVKIFKATFTAGDPIEVIGSVVKTGNGDVVLAREVTAVTIFSDNREGRMTLTLRDDDGAPVWKYWGVSAGD